ncbi:MAG: HpsJ family protein [Oscillatoria sp. PMC 1051.18]|nr:HpsJ family protein [Oscillatoria sp. PMC 1050.18]MEC5028758.1 HpsJ family protein [Oscillatoria sp. PMC 1051.18]
MNNAGAASPTAFALKIVGAILIISSLLDWTLLAIPFQMQNRGWQIQFISQIVDRGIIPMVGMAFLLAGYWMEDRLSGSDGKLGLRLVTFILASLLGLFFLLVIPVHLNNLRVQRGEALQQIEQRAAQAETQLEAQSAEINALLEDPQRLQQLDQALASDRLQGPQREQLEQIRQQIEDLQQDPAALEQRVSQAQNQLGERRLELESQAKNQVIESGVSTGVSSLLLAIGYIAIGWSGLKSMGGTQAPRRKASMR